MSEETYASRWSEDGQIYYNEGGAWGLNKVGKTIWLGKEKDIITTHPVLKPRGKFK